MVSLADSVSHRGRFVWLAAALASAITMFVATRPGTAPRQPRYGKLSSVGRCAERLVPVVAPKPDQIHVYTGLMVGRMGDEPYLHQMENLVTAALAKHPSWIVESTLTAGDASGFAISGTLDVLGVDGDRIQLHQDYPYVRCKVSMVLTTYPQHSVLGTMSGGASVKASTFLEEDLALARQACVSAVVDDITATQLIPLLDATTR